MGISSAKVTRASRLRISATPPNCHDDELTRMQADLGSRPVWLAAHCLPDEVPMLLKAHRRASRRLHRLLLILAVADYDALEDVRGQLQASGLRTADWEVGGEPDDNTQVVLSCDDDLGLWYRLAPLSVLAGTFGKEAACHNPLDAAALGSAVLHGPKIRTHAALYHRLAQAGAALQVLSAEDLAEQVIRLCAPDKAAAMALAGWKVVTEGAELTDQLLELMQDMLDQREAQHAAT
jgi:3-deoxy-D-manno-octulosonic-acid transferase